MSKRKIDFDTVREIALAMPDVTESVSSRGMAFKLHGRLFVCSAMHKSAEPNSLMARIGFDDRARLVAKHPDVCYYTAHYENYPAILVRLSVIRRQALEDLLGLSWRFVFEQSGAPGRAGR